MPLSPKDQLAQIFFPYVADKIRKMPPPNRRFAYYTTADTAMKILRSKQIWLRNTAVMNDYSEVEYGFNCFESAYQTEPGTNFKAALESCVPGLAEEVTKEIFNVWQPIIRKDTYVTCLSEHLSEEDQRGRLSMWRAYGNGAGVALVINGPVMFANTHVINVLSSPVAYRRRDEVATELNEIAKNILNHADSLKSFDQEAVKTSVFNMFLFGILCTKHPGFDEELEWRVIASPQMYKSKHLTSAIEVIRDVPQRVLKLDLKNHPEQDLVGLAIPDLIDRIIIGPCQFPKIVGAAFYELLQEAGVSDASERIVISNIPLRQR